MGLPRSLTARKELGLKLESGKIERRALTTRVELGVLEVND